MTLAESFSRTGFARFINSTAGRVFRIVVGLALLGWGFTLRAETKGMILMVVSLIPLVAGSFDLCLVSALLGGPISGSRLRGPAPKA